MRRNGVAWLIGVVAFATAAGTVRAGSETSKWPTPAAGVSASGDPEVLFTLDDGPHEKTTMSILDTLRAHHVHVIFFWTGWRVRGDKPIHEERRAIVARALADGHVIGNHTVNHAHLCLVPEKKAIYEIDENATIWRKVTGMVTVFFRSPYGGRCKRLEKELAERGLTHLHWDMDPLEWKSASTKTTRDYLIGRISRLKDGERAVVLIHDTKYATMKALPQVLDWIDQENARRVAAGRRPIRIISYVDLMRERIPAEVQSFVNTSLTDVTGFVPGVLDRLVAPLAEPPPHQAAL